VETLAFYLAILMPFLWWPVAIFGLWVSWRTPSPGGLLVTLGSLVLAVIGSLSVVFGPGTTFDEDGNVLSDVSGLLPSTVRIISSGVGLVLLVIGLVLLLSRSGQAHRSA
jgi:hypothetical protein